MGLKSLSSAEALPQYRRKAGSSMLGIEQRASAEESGFKITCEGSLKLTYEYQLHNLPNTKNYSRKGSW